MEILRPIQSERADRPLVATMGFFDGVHPGHRFVIEKARQEAIARGYYSAVITFWPHPRTVLHSHYQPKLLTNLEEKLSLIESIGPDYCIVIDFTSEIATLSAEEFIIRHLQPYGVKVLMMGYDHRFGKRLDNKIEDYKAIGEKYGIEIHTLSPLEKDARHISSSKIREMILKGDVEAAEKELYHPYQIEGVVCQGHQIGRKIGFPTANIELGSSKIIPGNGVYIGYAQHNGSFYKAMINIGTNPTVQSSCQQKIEAHLIDFSQDIYGATLSLYFKKRIRSEISFENLEQLTTQLLEDKKKAVTYLSDNFSGY